MNVEPDEFASSFDTRKMVVETAFQQAKRSIMKNARLPPLPPPRRGTAASRQNQDRDAAEEDEDDDDDGDDDVDLDDESEEEGDGVNFLDVELEIEGMENVDVPLHFHMRCAFVIM